VPLGSVAIRCSVVYH